MDVGTQRTAKLVMLPQREKGLLSASVESPARVLPWRVDPRTARWARQERWAVAAILLLGIAMRLWGLFHDLPFSFYGDELHFMRRSMAMGTGDLNPHWFHKPAFLMYVLAFVYGLYFLAGSLGGRFHSAEQFGAEFLVHPGTFLLLGRLVVFACGVLTVLVVQRIARRIFGRLAGLAAGLAAAVLSPMVASSQHIKSDVPAGLLMAVAVLAYVRSLDAGEATAEGTAGDAPRRSWRWLLAAAALAGAAMGTHYYGLVLVPAFALVELLRRELRPAWRLLRAALVPLVFVAAFFATSPYNFLDPTWPRWTLGLVSGSIAVGAGAEEAAPRYDPDSRVEYQPGLASLWGATVAFLKVLASGAALTLPLSLLALAGMVAALRRPATRRFALVVLVPFLAFALAAVTVAAYHAQPRHFNAVYPLLCTLLWPGAVALVRLLRLPEARRVAVAATAVAIACIPTLAETAHANQELTRLDSRVVAHRWILARLPADARLLVDDYGPLLNPDPAAVERWNERLEALPLGPFTQHQRQRLDLLARYPPADGRDLDELGHQWWLAREKSDAELRSDPVDLDMGSPLVSRVPQPLAEYVAQGYDYIVTNSDGRGRYTRDPLLRQGFPSFVRFYDSLARRRPIAVFDPARWHGKGPTVWVYALTPAAAAAASSDDSPEDVEGGEVRTGPRRRAA